MQQRPAGITVLAVVHFILAALMLLTGALWIGLVRLLASAGGELATPLPIDVSREMALLLRMGRVAGLLFIFYGVLKAVSGFGLLKLRNWARWLTIALAGAAVLLSLPGFVSALLSRQPGSLALNLLFAAGYGVIIWYLFRRDIKRAFGAA